MKLKMMAVGSKGQAIKAKNTEQEVLFNEGAPKSAKRLALSVLLHRENIDNETISKVAGVSPRQVRNYLKAYETHGTSAYTNDNRYRPKSELENHRDEIYRDLLARPVATSAEASERIFSLTGIKRCPTQVREFMNKLGLKPLKVAAIPAKADPVAQFEFVESNLKPRIKEAEKGERALIFMDAAHFVWQLYLGVLWCLARIFIQAPSGRTRINVLGAYDPIRNKLVKIINRSYINSSTIMELLVMIKAAYLDQPITIVLDNAKYQRCKIVMEKALSLNIELLFLPTYSPNLNIIERLWRFVKKECLYSKYYETANEFESAIVGCLEEINSSKRSKLETLMTLKFQLFPLKKATTQMKPVKVNKTETLGLAA